jgi:hypothetical protein
VRTYGNFVQTKLRLMILHYHMMQVKSTYLSADNTLPCYPLACVRPCTAGVFLLHTPYMIRCKSCAVVRTVRTIHVLYSVQCVRLTGSLCLGIHRIRGTFTTKNYHAQCTYVHTLWCDALRFFVPCFPLNTPAINLCKAGILQSTNAHHTTHN